MTTADATTTLSDQLAAGDVRPVATEPVTIVIFGGGGDLAHRKLLPALYNLHVDGLLPPRVAVVGVGRTETTDDAYRAFAKDGVARFSRRPLDEQAWSTFAASVFFAKASIEDTPGAPSPRADGRAFAPLGARLDIIEHEHGLTGNRIYYLAIPPSLFAPTVSQLDQARLIARPAPGTDGTVRPAAPFARLIVEKPIGHDLDSARAINNAIAAVFDERQIYRIDHYLGKETVQNILVLRFANSIFEPLFNQRYVDHVQITVAEDEGVGTRGGYYEQAGALRDMVQNHILQLLSLVTLEPPRSLDADVVRDEKLEVLLSLRPMEGSTVDTCVVRGQYADGFELGRPVPGYRQEAKVDRNSRTETFVAMQVFIDNWRWAGVPFFLRTGKRLPKRASEISIHLKAVPPILFNRHPDGQLDPNVLSIRIQPDEGFALGISSKIPGPRVRVYPVKMDFHYGSTFGGSTPEAYERLLLDVMAGDATLFMRRDAVEAAWRWVMPILERWAASSDPLPTYAAGEWGPVEADRLIQSTGRQWRQL
ncbi:MAG TPA: glucose-6-phosphate dehydrogenase [Vicinamibacterales bacterium]|jgi:glucose-6-phosphate 1-dehydrogenase|nr:glucose-6-phosphate dehydrogenase [Vicinamibacterales bacterium]